MLIVGFQIIIAVMLIAVILLQAQGSGLSTAFGGGGEFYRSRRSAEKILLWITIALAVLFCILSIALLIPR
ncbi:MAG: preprotein translocase subunit SecG [Candidatus Levyibacteriota bacterium]|nr:MAG: preprotein translocase subunit SecG [Candidatus Levybacteria bacterium]